jgi:hypothetical protein
MTKWSWDPVFLDKFGCIVENINILCNTNGKNLCLTALGSKELKDGDMVQRNQP